MTLTYNLTCYFYQFLIYSILLPTSPLYYNIGRIEIVENIDNTILKIILFMKIL